MSTTHAKRPKRTIHRRTNEIAAAEGIEVRPEVAALLSEPVDEEEAIRKHKEALKEIERLRFRLPKGAMTAVEMIREDRDR